MPRAVVSIFAVLVSAYPTVATESCLNGQCHDEVSLMQVKTSVSMGHNVSELALDSANRLDNDHVNHMLFDLHDPILLEILGSTTDTTTCLAPDSFTGKGNFPACAKVDEANAVNVPCTACMEDQWATGSGAGYECCNAYASSSPPNTAALKRAPLCGICLRFKGGGLKGTAAADAKKNCDQSAFERCAASYCQLADKTGAGITDALLKSVASDCSPENTGNSGTGHPPPDTDMVALVANNPQKGNLETFLKGKSADINAVTQKITGTASSSTMAMCVTKAQKTAFSTFSGPWGGDAQLAGLMAAQCLGGPKYLKAVIFFADVKEAHKMDILALKNLMERCKAHFPIAFNANDGEKVIAGLKR